MRYRKLTITLQGKRLNALGGVAGLSVCTTLDNAGTLVPRYIFEGKFAKKLVNIHHLGLGASTEITSSISYVSRSTWTKCRKSTLFRDTML